MSDRIDPHIRQNVSDWVLPGVVLLLLAAGGVIMRDFDKRLDRNEEQIKLLQERFAEKSTALVALEKDIIRIDLLQSKFSQERHSVMDRLEAQERTIAIKGQALNSIDHRIIVLNEDFRGFVALLLDKLDITLPYEPQPRNPHP